MFEELFANVDALCEKVGGEAPAITMERQFGETLCGPDSLLIRATHELVHAQTPNGGVVDEVEATKLTREFRKTLASKKKAYEQALSDLDRDQRFAPKSKSTGARDRTWPARWAALAALLRARLGQPAVSRVALAQACTLFNDICKAGPKALSEPLPVAAPIPLSAKQMDASLWANMPNRDGPWTRAHWMLWDVLCEINEHPVPVEEGSPVLLPFEGSSNHAKARTPRKSASAVRTLPHEPGYVMRLVVQALPGPPGLVTPNWWRLGMTPFCADKPGECFIAAVQGVLQAAAADGPPVRLRWHLAADDPRAWADPLKGRSGQAAAACAALAVFEKWQEQQKGGPKAREPVLDAHSAVTAEVELRSHPSFKNWRLLKVAEIPAKLLLAEAGGIDTVIFAEDQKRDMAGVNQPGDNFVPTVGDALERLRSVQHAFVRYGEHLRKAFPYYEAGPEPAE